MYRLLFANEQGELRDHPTWGMVGRSGLSFIEPLPEEMIPLPEGATLTLVPFSTPVGIDEQGHFAPLHSSPFDDQERVYQVGALLPQGFTRLLLPGFTGGNESAPLLGYTAVGVMDGQFYVAAAQTDEHHKWHPKFFNTEALPGKVARLSAIFKDNRIIQQLAKCALDYGCFTAQNIFYRRWEAGIPVSPVCNAGCLGCISLQESECCPSPQERIDFVPTSDEAARLMIYHLAGSRGEIISFGQGCEGEPSLQAEVIAKAIEQVRKETSRGTININTNAGYTEGIKKLCSSGLDSMRVSLISAVEECYQAYYRPKNYSLANVKESLSFGAADGVLTSLNLLAFPGFTDTEPELEALISMARETQLSIIQLRNLNIDPGVLFAKIKPDGEPLGMLTAIEILREELPGVTIGSYSKPV
ncbi:radical SAM protein [Metallumcola ferriviriculae]|uniref:Radical SAM protein n=1 Tax=Metallumcola ferriviriculae TaxID=3039180 RepID=A0AAU0ULQ7_9FIRM|nr:radical SAM protein [Desulfitibacteraceae bacterium MK1]